MLVVEYEDRLGTNLTAVWTEDSQRPRVFFNTPNARMFESIVNPPPSNVLESVLDSTALENAPSISSPGAAAAAAVAAAARGDGSAPRRESATDAARRRADALWAAMSDEQPGRAARAPDEQQAEQAKREARPPPPVIPFIKYASPGPPQSPWLDPDCGLPEFRILSLDGGGVRGAPPASPAPCEPGLQRPAPRDH